MENRWYGPNEKIPGEHAHDRCAYKDCKNGKYRMGGRKLFQFPGSHDAERLETWLTNCGNERMRKKAPTSIRRSGLCSDHFDPTCFTCEKKYTLKRNSVPLANWPPNLADYLWPGEERLRNGQGNVGVNQTIRQPKLFEDENGDSEQYEMDQLANNTFSNMEGNAKVDFNQPSTSSMVSTIDSLRTSAIIPPQLSTIGENAEVQPNTSNDINTPDFSATNITTMTSAEIVHRLNEDLNKDIKIDRLRNQNALLRKELKRLKQNFRRWEQRKQAQTLLKKKTSLKKQKSAVLSLVNDMDISPFSKAIISLQLHTRNAPYTEEEKNIARAFQQYSRSDLRNLKVAGCNFPSRSSIKRWLANNFDESQESVAGSSSDQN